MAAVFAENAEIGKRVAITARLWLRSLMLVIGLVGTITSQASAQSNITEEATAPTMAAVAASSTADHSKFSQLAGPFESSQEVNQACLSCHNTGAEQLHGTIHFTWNLQPETAAGSAAALPLGMRHLTNGFLLSTPSNVGSCTSCHIAGTRFDDPQMFDASSGSAAPVDCLSCHEPTGQWTIANFHEGGSTCSMCHDERLSGDTPEISDLAAVARTVGPTTRASCGACHFNADGGAGVKHGDLNPDLINPPVTLDVHMAAAPEGAGFSCSTCHTTNEHFVAGSRYEGGPGRSPEHPALTGAAASCQGCHSATPHSKVASGGRLDRHTDRVACETCHIPAIARGETTTRVLWDWSTVGQLGRDRKPMTQKDADGRITYATEKGNFAVAGNVLPTLIWSNGRLTQQRPGSELPASAVTDAAAGSDLAEEGDLAAIAAAFAEAPWVSSYEGDAEDAQSRIAPVKVMHSVVPIDAESHGLAAVLFSGRSGDALWNRFNWENAVESGMEAANLPFSGDVAFARVRQTIPVNHMVAPADQALGCVSCHSSDGLLADLPGGFLPGRDGPIWLDQIGLAILALTLATVLLHAMLRIGFGIYHRRARHD